MCWLLLHAVNKKQTSFAWIAGKRKDWRKFINTDQEVSEKPIAPVSQIREVFVQNSFKRTLHNVVFSYHFPTSEGPNLSKQRKKNFFLIYIPHLFCS